MTRNHLPARVRGMFGFTLPELLITLAIATLLLTVGVSSFNHYIRTVQVDTIINRLRIALSTARGESVQRAKLVVLCRLNPLLGICAGTAKSTEKDWSEGWLLFVDTDRDRQLDLSAGDELLRVFPALEEQYVLQWNRGDAIVYQPNGSLHSFNGTFCLADADNGESFRRELKVVNSGRVRATRDECTHSGMP